MTDDEALERIGHDPLLDVAQAAEEAGVSPWTIRQWVNRGHLEPVPGVKPLTFFASDVLHCRTARTPSRDKARVAGLASAWRAVQ